MVDTRPVMSYSAPLRAARMRKPTSTRGDAVVVREAVERQSTLMVVRTAEQHIAGPQQIAQIRVADPLLLDDDLGAETRPRESRARGCPPWPGRRQRPRRASHARG